MHCISLWQKEVNETRNKCKAFSATRHLFFSAFLYRLAVRVLSSGRAGAGKSLVVRRLSESLPGLKNNDAVMDFLRDMETDVPLCISVPIYGPSVHQCAIAESLLPHTIVPDLPLSRIFHLDVHPSVRQYFHLFQILLLLSLLSRI